MARDGGGNGNTTLYRSAMPQSASSRVFFSSATNNNLLVPSSLVLLVCFCLGAYIFYVIVERVLFTMRVRRCYRDVPSPPRHWAFGNLQLAGEKLNPAEIRHPDYGFEEIWEDMGRPDVFLIDLAPVDLPMVIVTDPSVAEQIVQPSTTQKYSCRKSDTTHYLWRLIGRQSMISAEGETWRALRKRFNKGFSPAHLYTLSALVGSKTKIFCDRLAAAAEKGETIALREYAQDLATDIITTIAIQKDFGSQSVPEGEGSKSPLGFLSACRKLSSLQYKVAQGFNLLHYLDPIRPLKAALYERIQNGALDDLIRQRLKEDQAGTVDGIATDSHNEGDIKAKTTTPLSGGRSIVQLALAGLTPTDELIANTRDQIKSFLFAGQDTTATTMQWIIYELSKASHRPRHAHFLECLKAEHDAVFGPIDRHHFSESSSFYSSVLDILSVPADADQILGDKLPYTTAFIREVLRIHPPAATARMCEYNPQHEPPQTLSIAATDDKAQGPKMTVRIDGCRMYLCHWIIQRDPSVWGPDAREFNPDRWLDETYMKSLPAGAWRTFERGPRNCIGQELAMMELKVVLCAVARGFVFEKVGPQTGREGEPAVFNTYQVTAIPSDGMLVKVRLREKKEAEKERDHDSASETGNGRRRR